MNKRDFKFCLFQPRVLKVSVIFVAGGIVFVLILVVFVVFPFGSTILHFTFSRCELERTARGRKPITMRLHSKGRSVVFEGQRIDHRN